MSLLTKRCQFETCSKKLPLSVFACKCEKFYCSSHRYDSEHKCTYNFQESAKQNLLKTMSTSVVAAKMEVI